MANFSVNSDFSNAPKEFAQNTARLVPGGGTGAPVVALEILRGRAKQRMRPVKVPVFLIGAAVDCDLVLADDLFPDVHTYLYVTPSGVTLRQLGSQPPLYVRGERMEVAALRDNETFRLGLSYEFRIHIDRQAWRDEPDHTLRSDVQAPTYAAHPNGRQLAHALLADVRAHLAQLSTAPKTRWTASGTAPRFLDQLQTRLTRAVA